MLTRFFSSLITLLCLTSALSAHQVWIEELDGKLVVRFAEYGEDYEKSPGRLDSLITPQAWTTGDDGKPAAFEVQKKADHFLLAGATTAKGALAETGFPVMKRGEDPARKPNFYARWHHAAAGEAKPSMMFDIVPTGIPGEVQVFFRGKALPDTKVFVVPPEGKEEELTTDKDGKAKFTIGKSGNYLLYCKHHREDLPGFSGGVAYEALSHNCSLIWKQP